MHCYRQTTHASAQSASVVLQAALYMSQQYSLASLHYPTSSSAFICTLYLPSCPSAPWQVNHLFSCCDSTILMSVTSTRPSWATHIYWTHTYRQCHVGTSNHITHTQTLFVRADSCPLKGRAVTPHHEPNEARVARRGGVGEERWRDGWSGTAEQYGGGWVELYASEATCARRQISGAWNRLWEMWRDMQRGGEREWGWGAGRVYGGKEGIKNISFLNYSHLTKPFLKHIIQECKYIN